ncbi:GNAT family N-acetyltransferase [Rhodovulum sp. P5]|uniref:GNAT family N-acetyltransferase n=1 Tax=Rhodovulum sp. P5 TaxID=1564506 RepID=UPI001561175F|nr:GNAT family N-acetyltransferase [Rhodovulum sp. P5]
MSLTARPARRADVLEITALFNDGTAGPGAVAVDVGPYEAAFDAMAAEPENHLIVGEMNARIVACCQLIFFSGLSNPGQRRAQVAALRVAPDMVGQGLEQQMIEDAKARARAAGCGLIQITAIREEIVMGMIEGVGFTASGTSYTQRLD